jgi:phenylpyruvate tautomerase PptA (4-oxalocrotonate tautomerase family)
MPLARIDLPAGKPASYRRAVADVVYEAMLETLKAPKDDRFQVISEHGADTLIIDSTYLGIERSADALTAARAWRPTASTAPPRPRSARSPARLPPTSRRGASASMR